MNWYLEVLRKYAQFDGRARRKEYWMFALFNGIITVVLAMVGGQLGTGGSMIGAAVLGLYSLGVFIPSLAVGVRRLHDTGRSGWWMLIVLVPLIGALALLIFAVQDSQPATNEYGPSPKSAMI